MSRWFRFYDEVLNDPKAQRLEPALFKFWVNLLCIASKNDGTVVKRDVTFHLRGNETEANEFLATLVERNLLEDRGDFYIPHNWEGRQYQSDSSTERVRKFRAKHRKHAGKRSGNVVVTSQSRTDTDTEQNRKKDIEAKVIPIGNSKRKKPETRIPDNWNPRVDEIQYGQKLGFKPKEIGREAEKFKSYWRAKDGRFSDWDQAFRNWLVKAADFAGKSPEDSGAPEKLFPSMPGSPEFVAWRAHFKDSGNKSMVSLLNQRELEGRPWQFKTQWPPGHKIEA